MTPADPLVDFFYDPDEEAVELPASGLGEGGALLAPAVDDLEELLAFRLGKGSYALEIGSIHEIIRPPPITAVPRAARPVLGVISLRGETLPVFDPRQLLKLTEPAPDARDSRRIVVVRVADGLAGLDVDEVEQVVRLPRREIEAPPRGLAGRTEAVALKGIGRWSGRLLAILDPDELLSLERRR